MKRLTVFTVSLLSVLLFPVHVQARSGGTGKWSAGMVFSPDYAYRTIKFSDANEHWKDFLGENQQPLLGYSSGITVLYRMHQNVELESGLLLSAKGYKYKAPELVYYDEPEPAGPLAITTTYNYRYLDVPLKMNWFILQRKARIFLSAGIAGNFFLDEFVVQELTFPDRNETSRYNQEDVDFNVVTLSLTGGAGIEYPLFERLHIRLNPEFRHAVTPIADTPGRYYLWSAGMNAGLFFTL